MSTRAALDGHNSPAAGNQNKPVADRPFIGLCAQLTRRRSRFRKRLGKPKAMVDLRTFFCGPYGVGLVSMWGGSRVDLGSIWGRLGVSLGSTPAGGLLCNPPEFKAQAHGRFLARPRCSFGIAGEIRLLRSACTNVIRPNRPAHGTYFSNLDGLAENMRSSDPQLRGTSFSTCGVLARNM